MGDTSDHADVVRLMRSAQGQQVMADVRARLRGLWITDVSFAPDIIGIVVTLTFQQSDAQPIEILMPHLFLDELRNNYSDVLDAEYAKDFPERC